MARKFQLFLQGGRVQNYLGSQYNSIDKEFQQLINTKPEELKEAKGYFIGELVRKYQVPKLHMKWNKEEGMKTEFVQMPFKEKEKKGYSTFIQYKIPIDGDVNLFQFRTWHKCLPEYKLTAFVDLKPRMLTIEIDDVYKGSKKLPVVKLKEMKIQAAKRIHFIKKMVSYINGVVDMYNKSLIQVTIELYEKNCQTVLGK